MENVTSKIVKELLKKYKKEDTSKYEYFHKTDKGDYAHYDKFLGINVPDIRSVVKQVYANIDFEEVQNLIESKYHEERLCALLILVAKMKDKNEEQRKEIVDFYLKNTKHINGWDLVDLSAPYIIGQYVLENPDSSKLLYKLASSCDMWEQRISIVANWLLIRNGEYSHILKIADMHINTKYDLIQKAVGWMLREVGKREYELEYNFLKTRYKNMPRTMLRYSIEKFDKETYKKFLKGEI